MKSTRVCVMCNKVIKHKKETHFTLQKTVGHAFLCYKCGKALCDKTNASGTNLSLNTTLHIHAGPEYKFAELDISTISGLSMMMLAILKKLKSSKMSKKS